MQASDIQAELKLRNLSLRKTPRGTLAVVGWGKLPAGLADAIRRNRDELLRMLPPPPIHPPEGVGWHVGSDGEIHEGLADWHADALSMVQDDSDEKRDTINTLRRQIRDKVQQGRERQPTAAG